MNINPTSPIRIVINDQSESVYPFEVYHLIKKSQSTECFFENEFLPRDKKLENDKSLDPIDSLTQRIDLISTTLSALYLTDTITEKNNADYEAQFINLKADLLRLRKKEGDLDKAIILFNQILDKFNFPDELKADIYNRLGLAFLDRGQKGDLIAAFNSFQAGAKLEHNKSSLKEELQKNSQEALAKIGNQRSSNYRYRLMEVVYNEDKDTFKIKLSQTKKSKAVATQIMANGQQTSSIQHKSNSVQVSNGFSKKSSPAPSESLFSHLFTTAQEQLVPLSPPSPSFSSLSSEGMTLCRATIAQNIRQWEKLEEKNSLKQKECREKNNEFEKDIQALVQKIEEIESRPLGTLEKQIKEKEENDKKLRSEMIQKVNDTKEAIRILECIKKNEDELELIKQKLESIKQKKELQGKKEELIANQQRNIVELDQCTKSLQLFSQRVTTLSADLDLFKDENEKRKQVQSIAYSGLGISSLSKSSSSLPLTSEINGTRKRKLSSSSEGSSSSFFAAPSSSLSSTPAIIMKGPIHELTKETNSNKS